MTRILATIIAAVVAVGSLLAATPGNHGSATTAPTAAAAPSATDSVSRAMATVWASQITPMLQSRYGNDGSNASAEFVRGLTDAFGISPDREPYYQGILQGFTALQRLEQMGDLGFPIDRAAFVAALGKALGGQNIGFTAPEADAYLNSYMARQYEARMAADTLSTESQVKFLESQAAREGVIRTPSGLLFEVITEGEGTGPTLDDTVELTYEGKLYNGTIFDSTDTPVRFPVKGLVPGFSQGLLMMKPGGTYRLFIPASLGYGPRGASGVIPGNAALDFTITLQKVIK